jgi:hypothetical protein
MTGKAGDIRGVAVQSKNSEHLTSWLNRHTLQVLRLAVLTAQSWRTVLKTLSNLAAT